jgi:SAM-dependent methyltransferase
LSPLADRFPATAGEPEDHYPLQLAVCTSCWLVQLTEIVPDGLLYGEDYAFFTGSSPSAVEYFRQYASWVNDRFDLDGKFLVEVACNDGTLLTRFGCRTLGVEPAGGPAASARAKGLRVVHEPFGLDVAKRIVTTHGHADLIIANNVAAHVSDLLDFFAGIWHLMAPGGAAVIEVQYLADLLAGNQFDHVYHEHRYYFTADSLSRVAARYGVVVRSVTRTPAQGGSIRVVLDRGDSDSAPDEPVWLRQPSTFLSLQGRAEHIRTRLLALLDEQVVVGRKVAGYAASAKSATLLNFCDIGPDRLDHIVDTTPHKIGRYAPGSKIPVCGPGERPEPDVYLLLAWNYLPGVLRREAAYTAAGGRFLVPLPMPVLL